MVIKVTKKERVCSAHPSRAQTIMAEVMASGARAADHIHSQEAECDGGWFSAPFICVYSPGSQPGSSATHNWQASQFNERNSPTSMPRGPSLGGSRFYQVESLHKSFQPVMSPPLLHLKTCRECLPVGTHEDNCVSMSMDTRL